MRLKQFSRVTEKGIGWLHKGVVVFNNGAEVVILDDTDTVCAWSDTATRQQAIDAWSHFSFGCSHFPANREDAAEVRRLAPQGVQIIHDESGESL